MCRKARSATRRCTSTTSFAWNTPATFLSLALSPADLREGPIGGGAMGTGGMGGHGWNAIVSGNCLQLAAQLSSAVSRPVLSPKPSTFAPIRSSIDTYRLVKGVSLGTRTCRPVLMVPLALPASRIGRSSWAWALPSLMPLP